MSINVSVQLWRGDPAEVRSGKTASGYSVSVQTYCEDGWPAGELSMSFRDANQMYDLGERICKEAERILQQEEREQEERQVMVAF